MIDRPPPDLQDIWYDSPVEGGQQAVPPLGQPRKVKARRARPRPSRRILSILGYGALALACACAATVGFLFVAAPVDVLRDRVIEQVKARTGRDLIIAGPTSLSLFPRLGISLDDVTLAGPEDMGAPPVLIVPKVDAELSFWSIITARAAVERVTLHRPTIELSVDADKRRSWERPHPRGERPSGVEDPAGAISRDASSDADHKTARALSNFGATSVRIVDGIVRYRGREGAVSEMRSFNLALSTADQAGMLKIDGSLTFRDTPIAIAGTASVTAIRSNQALQVSLKVSGPSFTGAFKGSLGLAAAVSLDGVLKLEAPSARAFGEWLGKPMPGAADAGRVSVSARVQVAGKRLELSDLEASLGDITLSGSLAMETGQERRRVTGQLQVSELDFGRLLMKPERLPKRAPQAPPTTVLQPAANPADRRDWSDDPFNVAILGLLDTDLALSANRVVYKEIKAGPGRLSVALEKGHAKITLEDLELYEGRARGVLTLDGTGQILVTGANLNLEHVALEPLLADALQFPWLEGRGGITLALAGQGLTERQIVESLNGTVKITSTDGAMIGLDVGKIMRSLQRARLPSIKPSPQEKTPYAELAGTFTIVNGVARNEDLRLIGPHVELNGTGNLDLGQREIDYTVRTKVGGAPEPGAAVKVGTIEVPVSIVGPWARPSFGIKGQEQITDALRQVRKNLKSQDVRDAIRNLLEGNGKKRVRPRELLEKLRKKD